MKKIIEILLTTIFIVTLSNCKKKEEEKPPHPQLKVTELQENGQRSAGVDLVSFPDGRVQVIYFEDFFNPHYYGLFSRVFQRNGDDLSSNTRKEIFKADGDPRGQINFVEPNGYVGVFSAFVSGASKRYYYRGLNSDIKNPEKIENNQNNYIEGINRYKDGYVAYGIKYGVTEDILVRRLDNNFETVWETTIDTIKASRLVDFIELTDGNIRIIVDVSGNSNNKKHIQYLDFDNNGNLVNQVKVEMKGLINVMDVKHANNKTYILASAAENFQGYFLFTCTNENGVKLWENELARTNGAYYSSLASTSFGFVIAGNQKDNPSKMFDLVITATDFEGNQIWQRVYKTETEDETAYKIVANNEYYYLLAHTIRKGNISAILVSDKF